jgi:hypothetical protein
MKLSSRAKMVTLLIAIAMVFAQSAWAAQKQAAVKELRDFKITDQDRNKIMGKAYDTIKSYYTDNEYHDKVDMNVVKKSAAYVHALVAEKTKYIYVLVQDKSAKYGDDSYFQILLSWPGLEILGCNDLLIEPGDMASAPRREALGMIEQLDYYD